MKSILINDTYGLDHLALYDQEDPVLGPHDVLVTSQAFSLNYLDLLVANGMFKNPVPHVIGSDVAGVVGAVGNQVKSFAVGDLVVSHYTQTWIDGAIEKDYLQSRLGVETGGIFSELVCLPETSWVPMPEHLTFEEASTLTIAGLTAWESLVNIGELNDDKTVYLQGSGGVSIAALQIAKAAGAQVIITTGSAAKAERLKALGADHVLNYSDEDIVDRVLQITNGRGVDIALEVVGSQLNETISLMSFKGRVALVGFIGGTESAVDVTQVITKNLKLQGVQVGSRDSFVKMNAFLEQHEIHPVVDQTYDFKDVQTALKALESGRHFGKVVLNGKWK